LFYGSSSSVVFVVVTMIFVLVMTVFVFLMTVPVFVPVMVLVAIIVVILAACSALSHQCAGTVDVGASQRHGNVCQDTSDQVSTRNGDAPRWAACQNVPLEHWRPR